MLSFQRGVRERILDRAEYRINEETGVMDAQVEVKEAQQDLRSFLGLTPPSISLLTSSTRPSPILASSLASILRFLSSRLTRVPI